MSLDYYGTSLNKKALYYRALCTSQDVFGSVFGGGGGN
jgi:hypothetical protein